VADAYKELGLLNKALEYYTKSIELDPKCGNPYNGLGNVYKAKGDCL
jgi:tetratricopeptide (TPR) repeat protein